MVFFLPRVPITTEPALAQASRPCSTGGRWRVLGGRQEEVVGGRQVEGRGRAVTVGSGGAGLQVAGS